MIEKERIIQINPNDSWGVQLLFSWDMAHWFNSETESMIWADILWNS